MPLLFPYGINRFSHDAAHIFVGIEATVLYELSDCSEDALALPDHSLDDTDLYLESSDFEKDTTSTLDQGMFMNPIPVNPSKSTEKYHALN